MPQYLNGKYYVSNFPLDYGSYVYEEGKIQYNYNIDKAKSILSENGWEYKYKTWQKVENYRTLKLKFNLVVNSSNAERVLVAENIKKTLETLGIKINIIKANDKTYQNYLENKNYDIILTGKYSSLSPDVSSYFGAGNLANYNNENVNQLLNEIVNINDEKLLKAKYSKLMEIYTEEMPYVYLYSNRNTVIYSSRLMGDIKPNNYNLFYNIKTWYRQ